MLATKLYWRNFRDFGVRTQILMPSKSLGCSLQSRYLAPYLSQTSLTVRKHISPPTSVTNICRQHRCRATVTDFKCLNSFYLNRNESFFEVIRQTHLIAFGVWCCLFNDWRCLISIRDASNDSFRLQQVSLGHHHFGIRP